MRERKKIKSNRLMQYLQGLVFLIASLFVTNIQCGEYPCNNFGLMDGEFKSPCMNSASYSYNLKKIFDMGGDVLKTSRKLTISGWWKPVGNLDLTNEWQTLFYLSTDTNGVVLPTNGQMELNGDKQRRLLAFFFNKNGLNELQAQTNLATPVVIPNFKNDYMDKWSFYAFSINFDTKIFKVGINPIDTSTQAVFQGSFTANIPNNFGDYPNLGLYFDATPAYFPSCSYMQGIVASANYEFDQSSAQHLLELRHSNLKLLAHYNLMSPRTINPQLVEDVQFSWPDFTLGSTRDPEPILDPTWQVRGTYQELTFQAGNTAILKTDKTYNELTVQYWMTINSAAPSFKNFGSADANGNILLSIEYRLSAPGYLISVCIQVATCYTTGGIALIQGASSPHEAIISISEFPGAAKLLVCIYINGQQVSTGYINTIWPNIATAAYFLNNPTTPFANTYSMRNLRIYSGSYFRQFLNDPGLFTFCNANCVLHAYKELDEQECAYCQPGFTLYKGYCWPSADYCPKANAVTPHTQPYAECTPCLSTFAQVKKQCDYDIDLNPLVVSGIPDIMTVNNIGVPNSLTKTITFSPPLPAIPQIFLSMSTFDYDLGGLEQNFRLSHSAVTVNGFDIIAERVTGASGTIYRVQPFYIASNDPDIEIGQFTFTSTTHPNLANVAASDQYVEQIIYFTKRQKFLPQISAGYTGISVPAATGHSFEITATTIDVDKFKIRVKAFQGIPINRIDIYYIAMKPEIPVYSIIKDFQKTDEAQMYSYKACDAGSTRICYFIGPAGKVPPQTVYLSVITIFNQSAAQNNIRRVLTYQGIDTSKSTFSFQYVSWCNTQTSQFGIQSFALVKPCVKFYCDCDPVPPGYYYLPTEYACPKCEFKCLYCENSAANCTKCRGNREMATGCLCPAKTYEDYKSTNCPDCKFGCASCTDSANNCGGNCLGNRVGNDCSCPVGTVEDNVNAVCTSDTDIGCDPKCARCSILDKTKCSVCAPGRVADAADPSKCVCPPGQVDENNTCYNCHPRCNGCTGRLPNQCIACKGSTRINAPQCNCKDGFYDDGINLECQPCSSFCVKCSGGTNNDCIECKLNRSLNTLTSKCECPLGTYDTGLVVCPACTFKCKTCTSGTACVECAGDRASPPTCDKCPDGKFSGPTAACTNCGYKCGTCTGSESNCTTCKGQFRSTVTPSCDCLPNYYDAGVSDCKKCDDNCKTCTTNATNCLTCYENRVISNNKCVCPPNFYEVQGQQLCLPCNAKCNTCNAQGCLKCASNRENPPSCSCPFGTFDNTPATINCPTCSAICDGCIDSSTKCIECKGQRTNKPSCDTCPSNKYPTSNGPDFCDACNDICQKCSINANNCTECTGYRIKVSVPNTPYFTCACQGGTYEDLTSTQCRVCYSTCSTCSGGSRLDCLTCKAGFEKSTVGTIAGSCDCPSNSFMTADGKYCQSCDYKCLTCKGPTSNDCITCRDPKDCQTVEPEKPEDPKADVCKTYGILSDDKCDCPEQQYYSQTLEKCIACALNCKRCFGGDTSQCTDCVDGYIQQGNKCVLPVTSQESETAFGWILGVFLGILCVLLFPYIYMHFIKKLIQQYITNKNVKPDQLNDQDQQNGNEFQQLNNQDVSIHNYN